MACACGGAGGCACAPASSLHPAGAVLAPPADAGLLRPAAPEADGCRFRTTPDLAGPGRLPTPSGALLLPEPWGSIPADAGWLKQLQDNLRRARRNAGTKGGGGPSLGLSRPGAPPTRGPCGTTTHLLKKLGSTGPGDIARGPATPGLGVIFQHDAISFELPLDWLFRANLTVPGAGGARLDMVDVLQVLWDDVLQWAAASGLPMPLGVDERWAGHFGCWNIPEDGVDALFFVEGGGAPAWYVGLALMLVASHTDLVEDRVSGSGQGEGFGEFLRGYLAGRVPRRHADHRSKPSGPLFELYLNLRSGDPEFGGSRTDPPHVDCTEWPDGSGCGVPSWEDYEVELIEMWSGPHWRTEYYGSDTTSIPRGCDSLAFAKDAEGKPAHVNFHASMPAAEGELCDRLLHAAWMALEYVLAAPDLASFFARAESHATQAQALGRFVLGRVLGFSQLFLHEAGHVFNFGGHCEQGKHCFMDYALDRFSCGLRARLGLPSDRNYWFPDDPDHNAACVGSTGFHSPDCGTGYNGSGRGVCRIDRPAERHSAYMHCAWQWCAGASPAPVAPSPWDLFLGDPEMGSCAGVEVQVGADGVERCEWVYGVGSVPEGDPST